MNSLVVHSNGNRIYCLHKVISSNLNISKRNYTMQNSSLKLKNTSSFIIFTKLSQDFDIYTLNRNIILQSSYRVYASIPKVENNSNSFFKKLFKIDKKKNSKAKIPNTPTHYQLPPLDEKTISIINNINKINNLNNLSSINRSATIPPPPSQTLPSQSLKNQTINNFNNQRNASNINKNVTLTSQASSQSSNSTFKNQAIKIKNNVNNTNNGINVNKGLVNEKIDKKNISSNVETSVKSQINNPNINEVKIPSENISINRNTNSSNTNRNVKLPPIKKNYEDEKTNKEVGLFNWVTSLFHGRKHKTENVNPNIKSEKRIEEHIQNVTDDININNSQNINMDDNTILKDSAEISMNSDMENKKVKKTVIPTDIIIKQTEKNDTKISIKNIKNWFNRKMHPKKQNQLKTMDNGELMDLDDDMNKFAIENELRDILNDSTVGSVENIINSATKGIILPTKNPLTNPPKDTMSFKFNELCHRINQYFFPLDKKMDETKLSTSMKLLNRFTKTSLDARRIVILGVHGWFPKRSIQKMVGDPTGTSEKFCQEMAYSVITFFNDLGMEITNENVSQIPLSGEGIVENRVDHLYEQLEKRMDEVRNADIVLVSAHSQGTPVSVFLLNRLLENKEIDPERQTIGMLAMAGIHHGPFPIMRENFIVKFVFNSNDENDVTGDAGQELFEFNDPHEKITKYYHAALFNVLNSGIRICAVGSWFDQVVPLYSATLQGINHPNLYRAIYVERRDYNDDFFTNLIEFDMKLRNHGISDYGLLIHLSELIIGSFVHGTQGHSTIYESDNVYKLLLSWITTSKASTKHMPYNKFFDPTQLCGIEDDKEEESYTFEPITYSNSTSSNSSSTTIDENAKSKLNKIQNISLNDAASSTNSTISSNINTNTSALPSDHMVDPSLPSSAVEEILNKPEFVDPSITNATSTTSIRSEIEITSQNINEKNLVTGSPVEQQQEKDEGANSKTGTSTTTTTTTTPPKMAMDMEMSKFRALHKLDMILEQLQSKRIRRFKSPKTLNTYYIPWIISNLQNSSRIKDDPELLDDLKQLMIQYREWRPTTKPFKQLKHRLAPIQDMFRMAGITITPEDLKKMKDAKAKQQQQQQSHSHSAQDWNNDTASYDDDVTDDDAFFHNSSSSSSSNAMNFNDDHDRINDDEEEDFSFNNHDALQEINQIIYKEGKA